MYHTCVEHNIVIRYNCGILYNAYATNHQNLRWLSNHPKYSIIIGFLAKCIVFLHKLRHLITPATLCITRHTTNMGNSIHKS